MKKNIRALYIVFLISLFCIACNNHQQVVILSVYPDSVLNDVSHHPVGINVDYFMDDGRFPGGKRETIEALRKMGVKYLRYPGGEKSDLNLFSIPPYEKSVPTLARTGKDAVADYWQILNNFSSFKYDVLDFDEFMDMCRELNAEPVIVVPADNYLRNFEKGSIWTKREDLIKHAVEWVQYANIKKKYEIKYWMIGNECWNPNNPNSTAEIYAKDVLDFAKAMKAVDSSIAIIPNGNTVEYFKPIITIAGDYIDYLTFSNYPVWDYKAGYITYRDTLQNLMGGADRAMKAIQQYATEKQKKRIKLIVSEYGPFDWNFKWPQINDMGHNLANFEMTGEQLLRPEIEFSCFWNTRWLDNDSIPNEVWDVLDSKSNFNANGYGLMIWGKFLADKMVKTTSILHLRLFAGMKPDKKRLFIYLMNKSDSNKTVKLTIENRELRSVVQAWELIGKNADDVDPVWQRKEIKDPLHSVNIKGNSIVVAEYQLQ